VIINVFIPVTVELYQGVDSTALIEEVGAAIEPERLAHISLGQENPRMRMNPAPA